MNLKTNSIKRILSLTLVLTVLATIVFVPSAFAVSFTDLPQDHWAYSFVNTLVESGTINGYSDGTFRPDGTVSRAEFVKMIGKGNANNVYSDVTTAHWAYDYIVTSGMDALQGNNFAPDVPITRGDVVKLLWTRNGSKTGYVVPNMITSQGAVKDAVAWVYSNGIMVGDDYIDLRLNDSLTRAEAATLIVRAKAVNVSTAQVDFYPNLSDKLLETVYNSFDLFDDKPYSPDATITQGELAYAAMRIACAQNDVTYDRYKIAMPFTHKYARPLYVYGTNCIGEDKINAEYADQTATVADAICALMFGTNEISSLHLGNGDGNNYPELAGKALNEKQQKYLKMAYNNGITLYAGGKINADKAVTLKELACFMLQCDGMFGFETSRFFSADNTIVALRGSMSLNTDLGSYPSNAGNYPLILKDVPKKVYETSYVTYGGSANTGLDMDLYNNCRDFYEIYIAPVKDLTKAFEELGAIVKISYIPSLVKDNGHGYTYRLMFYVYDNPTSVKISDVIDITDGADGNKVLKKGETFFIDFDTGSYFTDIFMTSDCATVNKVIY